jgi:hypothetical protein
MIGCALSAQVRRRVVTLLDVTRCHSSISEVIQALDTVDGSFLKPRMPKIHLDAEAASFLEQIVARKQHYNDLDSLSSSSDQDTSMSLGSLNLIRPSLSSVPK